MFTLLLSLGVVLSAGLIAETAQDDALPPAEDNPPKDAQDEEHEPAFDPGPSHQDPAEPRADIMDNPEAWLPVA